MGILAVLIVAVAIILGVFITNYICTSGERRIAKELWKMETTLYREKLEAERAKQYARAVGSSTIDKINEIANIK